ncbi:hypothetical protein, partial [Methanosarcina sp. 2.H.T.1A.15]|uniref:hypothetical protein n=1 Tax=Methanosarcina sp. 2.H.T.1A.15 TaxID=1483596 RepID=UPI002285D921
DLHYPLRRQRQMCIRDRNNTSGRPRTMRIKLSLSTGISTKISVRTTRPTTNSRSDGNFWFPAI